LYFWANVLLGKRLLRQWLSGQMSFWENVLLGKCLLGKCPSGQTSYGQMSFWANVLLGKFLLGKCRLGKCCIGKRHRSGLNHARTSAPTSRQELAQELPYTGTEGWTPSTLNANTLDKPHSSRRKHTQPQESARQQWQCQTFGSRSLGTARRLSKPITKRASNHCSLRRKGSSRARTTQNHPSSVDKRAQRQS
jgi:hypothetical protein